MKFRYLLSQLEMEIGVKQYSKELVKMVSEFYLFRR